MRLAAALLAAAVLAPLPALGQRPPGTEHEGAAFTFTRILDDVYHAVGTGSMSVGANSVIVINEADVLLVDSHVSPAAATVLLEELRQITDKPVRYVVDTHFHFDHAHGNQIFPASVEIIGHEFTHHMLASGASRGGVTWSRFIETLPQQIAVLRAQLNTTSSTEGRAALRRRISIQESYRVAADAVQPTPPTVSFSETLTLHRGGREIRILFFGRGHTGGDAVVYLPRERVLMTGDLVNTGTSFMGDAYPPDWIETLERLKRLEFDVALPGHGPPFRDRAPIDNWQAYLRDFWTQATALKRAGVSADEAAARIDLRAHAPNYPAIRAVGADRDAVRRAYAVMDEPR